MIQPWRLRLLGTFELSNGDVRYERCRTAKMEAMLAYLGWHLGSSCSREQLADMLWPDSEIEAASVNLRVAINSLRQQLEPLGVVRGSVLSNVGRSKIALNPEIVTCDVVDFRRLLKRRPDMTREERQANLLAALDVYDGELMPGHYEDFIEEERHRLAAEFMDALQELSDLLKDTQDLDTAIKVARRKADENPYDEDAQCELMNLLTLAGRHDEVLQRYERIERLYAEEDMGSPPGQVRKLYEDAVAASGRRRPVPSQMQPSRPPTPLVGRAPIQPVPVEQPPAVTPDHYLSRASGRPPAVRPRTVPLPKPLTRFFGRETELAELEAIVRSGEHRLITITGMGGIGKTRLSVEFGRRYSETGERHVAFIPLAELVAGDEIPPRLASVLGMSVAQGIEVLTQVEQFLSTEPWLLIFDNVEQVATGATDVILRLLENVPTLCVLATSRHALEIMGERQLPLDPLPVPEGPDSPEALLRYPSVQLFVDRAAEVACDLRVTPRNAADIVRLCRELEGLPLSLELAAGWAADLTLAQMVARLANKFDLLVGRRVGLPARQASLLASMEWSYRLLTPELQRIYGMVSVFHGGWTLEALDKVCGVRNGLHIMAELRTRSMVTADRTSDETRYGMLEVLREFAREKLDEADRPFLANRHATYFGALAEEAYPHLRAGSQSEWLDRMQRENGNLRAALEWSLEHNPADGLRMARHVFPYWTIRGHWSEARRLLTLASKTAEQHGGRAAVAELTGFAGVAAMAAGDTKTSLSLAERSVALWREIGDERGLLVALNNLALAKQAAGDLAGAAAVYEEAMPLTADSSDRLTADLLTNYATLLLMRGDAASAKRLTERALQLHEARGDRWAASLARANLGDIAAEEEDADAAWCRYGDALPGLVMCGDLPHSARVLRQLAAVAAYVGRHRQAALLAGCAAAIQERSGQPASAAEAEGLADTIATIQNSLPDAEFHAAWAEGAAMSLEDVVHLVTDTAVLPTTT